MRIKKMLTCAAKLRVANSTPDGVFNADAIIFVKAQRGGKSGDEASRRKVLFANRAPAELAYGSRFFFTVDAFHDV